MDSAFWFLLLGHLTGDYLFQNDWMAKNKVKNDAEGWLACLVHGLVYSLCVSLFVMAGMNIPWTWGVLWLVGLVFLTHFPIDKVSFGKWWLRHVLGKGYPVEGVDDRALLPLYWFVYIVVDNTLHLILMTCALISWFHYFG